jgi:hypothetical protein
VKIPVGNKILFFLFLTGYRISAQIPNTDIWLFQLKKEKENIKIEKGENITHRDGYDNQPSFSHNGKRIYYVSIGADKQSDIYVYSIGSKKSVRLTNTKESEYSPTVSNDETKMYCVAVLQDSSQIIIPFDLKDGKILKDPYPAAGSNRISQFDSVGYFTFLNEDTVLYYKLTKPHTLRARSLSSGADVRIADNPIRGFKKIPANGGAEFIFGVKESDRVDFYKYDAVLRKAVFYCSYPSASEDIIWHPKWGLLKSEKAEILRFDEAEKKWISVFDLSSFGVSKITRFSFDDENKKLLVVDNK